LIRASIGNRLDETMSVQQILKNPIIRAYETKRDQDKDLRIRKLTLIIRYKDATRKVIELKEQVTPDGRIAGPVFDEDQLKMIAQLKAGDKILLEDIMILIPDGNATVIANTSIRIIQ
jgi:hypothetical protein